MRDRRAVQPRTHGNTVARELLRQQLAVHIPAADGQHCRLTRRIRRCEDLQPRLRAQLRRQALREPPLPPLDIFDALHRQIPDPGEQARNAGDVVRSGLEPVGQFLRHILQHALRAGAAAQQGLWLRKAQQDARALRAEQALMPRHGHKRCTERRRVERDTAGRLRGIHDQWDACSGAKFRDPPHGQQIAEHVRHHRAHDRLRARQRTPEGADRRLWLEERTLRHAHLRAQRMEWARDGVVLVAGDHDRITGRYERVDRDIERVRRVHGEHDALRLRNVKQLRRRFSAGKHRVGRAHGGAVAAAAGTRHRAHGHGRRAHYRRRLEQTRSRRVQIDHTVTSW